MAYPALLAPMIISGTGIALALPALTKVVVSSVPPGDIGKATGVFSTVRQLGGAFGVAILAAVFAAAGSYASPAAFSNGFGPATYAAAGLALAAALAALALPSRRNPAPAAPAELAPALPQARAGR
jgi:voltage-gated potassium channel Kch